MDVPTSIRIADLKREIEGIQELNRIYHFQRHHTHLDRAAFERRKARLEQIKQELTALRPSPRLVSNRYNER